MEVFHYTSRVWYWWCLWKPQRPGREGWACFERNLRTTNVVYRVNADTILYEAVERQFTYVDSSLGFDKPSTEHWLYLAATQLGVHLMDLVLHLFFQQQPPQSPVEKLAARPPVQYVLFTLQNITDLRCSNHNNALSHLTTIFTRVLNRSMYKPKPFLQQKFGQSWCKFGRLFVCR